MTTLIQRLEKDPEGTVAEGVSPAAAIEWLDYCDVRITESPLEGLLCARTAVRITLRLGMTCLHVRSVGTLATAWRFLEELDRSGRDLGRAFEISKGCRCVFCWTDLNRKLALLRESQGRLTDALEAVETSLASVRTEFDRGKTLLVRGAIYGRMGHVDKALRDHGLAFSIVPPEETTIHSVAQHRYALALCESKDPAHIDAAAELLPKVRASYKGLRRAPLLRAKERWLEGSVYSRQAEVKPDLDSFQRYGLRCKSAHHLRLAVKKLRKLKFRLDLTGCAADLAAVEYHIDRTKLEDLLRDTTPAPELAGLWATVRRAVDDGEAVFWAALEALRAATVERGCPPPLVPYGAETGW